MILDRESLENDLKDFSFTFVELPKFKKDVNRLTDIIYKWCYFFKHAQGASVDEMHKLIGHDEIIERAVVELDRFSWTSEELHAYDQSEKYSEALLASLDQKFDEGKQAGVSEGLEKGQQIGLAKGEQIGLAKGEQTGREEGEKQKALDIAKNLHDQGIPIEIICKVTGLTKKNIAALIGSLN